MTGILLPSSGDVIYENLSLKEEYLSINKNFGYCPQFDVVDRQLNLIDHIKFYAGIKDIKVEPEEVLKEIDLVEKKFNSPYELSADQRRKFSLSLVLLGSAKYVFLDEPTTGLDPYSRKKIWEYLSKKKNNRVIVITTHYMDEADILTGLKMIISHGMIKYFESSLFLKKTFNMNYILDINSSSRDTKEIDQVLSNLMDFKEIHHKTIKREQMDQYIISYYIPQKWSNQFCKLFTQLEHLFSINNNNKYKSYYISSPILEDLLSKIETDNISYSGSCSYASSQEKVEPKFLGDNNYTNLDKLTYDNSTILNSPSYHDNNNSYNKVDISTNKNINIHDIFTDRISNYNYNIYQSNNDNSKDNSVHENTNNSINNRNNGHLCRNVLLLSLIRIKLICGNFSFIIYTVIILIITISIILYFNGYPYLIFDKSELGKLKFDLDIYPKSWFIEQGTDEIGNHILRNSNFSKFITSNVIDYNKSLSLTSLKNQQPNSIREIYTGGFKILQNDKILDITIYHNDTYLYSLPLAINMINNAIVSYYHSNYSLVTNYQPFTTNEQSDNSNTVIPYNKYLTKINTNYIKYQSLIEQYLILIFSSIFSIISVIYTPLIVKDKEDNNFHLLSLAGISQKCYWLGILLSDIVLSLNIDVQCIII